MTDSVSQHGFKIWVGFKVSAEYSARVRCFDPEEVNS